MEHIGIPGSMGRLAEGNAFFDREHVIARAWDLLKTSNLLLLAPRRVGKSSLLNRMKSQAPSKGHHAIYLSIPDAEDELDFVKRLVRALREADGSVGGWIARFKDKLPEDLEFVLKTSLVEMKAKKFDWRMPADQLEALLKSGDSETILFIDELPYLIGSLVKIDPSGARAERFLLWLKRLREQYRPRWFFAGSIGLDSVARRLKLSGTIHDLQPIELGELSVENARAYLMGRGQFLNWTFEAETVDAILDAVEWHIPFHLNLVFEQLREVVMERSLPPSADLVEIALQRLMKNGRAHFDHWNERLAKLLGPSTQENCGLILGITSRAPGGVSMATIDLRLSQKMADQKTRTEMLRQALDLLISDGYLVKQGDVVRFRSSLLRRYWMELQA